jgi:hypothetical protein
MNDIKSSPETTTPSPPPSPTLSHTQLPKLHTMLKQSQVLIALLILASLGSIYIMLDSLLHYQRDVTGCQTSYMRPEYIKQTSFDSEMTRFAGKYGLYLYREKGVDYSDQVSCMCVSNQTKFSYTLFLANRCTCIIYTWSRRQL